MLRDPGDIVARASGGDMAAAKLQLSADEWKEDRRFDTDKLI